MEVYKNVRVGYGQFLTNLTTNAGRLVEDGLEIRNVFCNLLVDI